MKNSFLVIHLFVIAVLLNSCSCGIYTAELVPKEGMQSVSKETFFKVVQENDFRSDSKNYRGLKGSMVFRRDNDKFVLQDSICPNPINIFSTERATATLKKDLNSQCDELVNSFSRNGVRVSRNQNKQ